MTSWPDGANGAVAFTFDFDAEEVWLAEDPDNANRPGVLSMQIHRALPDRCLRQPRPWEGSWTLRPQTVNDVSGNYT
jgi:hypothetical protein